MMAGQSGQRYSGAATAVSPGISGFTLLEMMVVLVVMGVVLSVSVTALPGVRARNAESLADRLARAQRQAVATGRPVTVTAAVPSASSPDSSVSSILWRFLPDGRAVGPGVDPRNGQVIDSLLYREPAP